MGDSFVIFSILALIVAIFQILPRTDIIEIQASLDNQTKKLFVFFILFILCLMVVSTTLGYLVEIFAQVLSIIVFFLCLIIYLKKRTIKDVSKFIEDLDELYFQGNAFLFFKLIDSHYQFLIADPFREKSNLDQNKDQELLNPIPIRKKEIYIPNEEIQTYIRGRFLDPNFILKLALINPYLGVRCKDLI